MLFITQASTNYLTVTCKEKELLTSPSYLIKFICVSTKDVRYCWTTDTSSFPNRYQYLEVVETSTPTSGTTQVKLDTKASWDYYIYEYTGTAPATETGLNEVEQGQVTINHSQTTLTSFTGYQSTYKKYDG